MDGSNAAIAAPLVDEIRRQIGTMPQLIAYEAVVVDPKKLTDETLREIELGEMPAIRKAYDIVPDTPEELLGRPAEFFYCFGVPEEVLSIFTDETRTLKSEIARFLGTGRHTLDSLEAYLLERNHDARRVSPRKGVIRAVEAKAKQIVEERYPQDKYAVTENLAPQMV